MPRNCVIERTPGRVPPGSEAYPHSADQSHGDDRQLVFENAHFDDLCPAIRGQHLEPLGRNRITCAASSEAAKVATERS